MVFHGALVLHNRVIVERQKAVQTPRRDVQLDTTGAIQLHRKPLPVRWRQRPDIHGHIVHPAVRYAYQLPLRMGGTLGVQPAQHTCMRH